MTVIRKYLRFLIIAVIATALRASSAGADEAQSIAETLSAGAPPVTDIDAALGADALAALKQVYAARQFRSIWTDATAKALLDRARAIAIVPKVKPLLAEAARRENAADSQALAERDLLLSALYGVSAKALNPSAPEDFAAALDALVMAKDQMALLQPPPPEPAPAPAAQAPEPAPAAPPAAQTPAAPTEPPAVHGITVALDLYRKIATTGGWPTVAEGPKLLPGDSGPRVDALRRRLIATGDLATEATAGPVDDPLQDAVRRFQTRHGLESDGIAGADTIAALNVPVERRIAMLEAAQQRLAARDWKDSRYLLVDIVGAAYRLVEDGKPVLSGPALLGRPSSPTPPLDGVIDRIELHPAWRIPQQVADARLWPLQDSDATYFYSHGIHVTDDGLAQDPGGGNPLGAVKFVFDNPAGIALHDDPNPKDFDAPDRYTTLGCVALAGAEDLARRLLSADPAWTAHRIDAALAGGKTETVTLTQPLTLHIVDDTAWVDPDGTVEFRDETSRGEDGKPPMQDPAGPCGS
jgi:murein L,D-transpeptidase YcbB/YkuD